MTYNLSWIANSSGILQLVQRVNSELLLGWFGVLLLLAIGTILFLSFTITTNNTRKAAAATSVICFGLCLMLRAISLVPDLAIFVTLILAAITVAVSRKE